MLVQQPTTALKPMGRIPLVHKLTQLEVLRTKVLLLQMVLMLVLQILADQPTLLVQVVMALTLIPLILVGLLTPNSTNNGTTANTTDIGGSTNATNSTSSGTTANTTDIDSIDI
jgi:hypothetical protein